jgi:hypothetical protein
MLSFRVDKFPLLVIAFLSAAFLAFVGDLESAGSVPLSSRATRAFILVCIFCGSIIWLLSIFRRIRSVGFFHCCVAGIVLYGVLISIVRGAAEETLSSSLRMMIFLIVSIVTYNIMKEDKRKIDYIITSLFVILSIFFIGHTIYDVTFDGGVFMNGATRYYGSIGSPIGFASVAFVVLTGVGYYWIRLKSNLLFLLMVGLVWVIGMTATRSITIMAILVLWWAIVLYLPKKISSLWILITPLVLFTLLSFGLSDSGVFVRIINTLQGGEIDGSSSFRLFILTTFFENIQLTELFFGLGLGNFHIWFQNATGVNGVAPHFEVLWILSEFGIVVLMFYFFVGVLYFSAILCRWISSIPSPSHVFLTTVFFLTPQVFMQFSNPFYFYQFVIVFALLSGIVLSQVEFLDVKLYKE